MHKHKNLLVMVIIALLAIGLIVCGLMNRPPSGEYVLVTVGGHEYGRYLLGRPQEVVIALGDGEENILTIEEDGFYMKSATCHDQLCVGQGKVTPMNVSMRMLGSDIICLPHKVVVSLVENEQPADAVDGV